uniref:Uncharacterized protein n=1 Tax=Anopheles melas TaxID=34690 RepID=A0A182TJZ4_9DIPT
MASREVISIASDDSDTEEDQSPHNKLSEQKHNSSSRKHKKHKRHKKSSKSEKGDKQHKPKKHKKHKRKHRGEEDDQDSSSEGEHAKNGTSAEPRKVEQTIRAKQSIDDDEHSDERHKRAEHVARSKNNGSTKDTVEKRKGHISTDPDKLVQMLTQNLEKRKEDVVSVESESDGTAVEDAPSPDVAVIEDDELNLEDLMRQKALLQARLGEYATDEEDDGQGKVSRAEMNSRERPVKKKKVDTNETVITIDGDSTPDDDKLRKKSSIVTNRMSRGNKEDAHDKEGTTRMPTLREVKTSKYIRRRHVPVKLNGTAIAIVKLEPETIAAIEKRIIINGVWLRSDMNGKRHENETGNGNGTGNGLELVNGSEIVHWSDDGIDEDTLPVIEVEKDVRLSAIVDALDL